MDIISNKEDDNSDTVFVSIPNFLDEDEIIIYENYLAETDNWKTGYPHSVPRYQKWYSDNDQYFSKYWLNQTHDRWKSNTHEEWLLNLRKKVQNKIDSIYNQIITTYSLDGCNELKINSSLINYYRDGKDSIKYHTDDEKVFGSNPTVAMLTFGSVRNLDFKRIYYKRETDMDIRINESESYLNRSFKILPGTLFMMMGSVQKYYCHGVEKDQSIVDPRYSITFRAHKN
jgi:alkylated DNA repair dioxygenase AlkB